MSTVRDGFSIHLTRHPPLDDASYLTGYSLAPWII